MLDLRFIIGSFFLLIGSLLLIASLTLTSSMEMGTAINRYCGLLFILFSAGMLFLWKYRDVEADQEKKKLEVTEQEI